MTFPHFDPVSILESRFLLLLLWHYSLRRLFIARNGFRRETRALCVQSVELYSYRCTGEKWYDKNVTIFLNWKIFYFISFYKLIVKKKKGNMVCETWIIQYVTSWKLGFDRNKGFRACAVCLSVGFRFSGGKVNVCSVPRWSYLRWNLSRMCPSCCTHNAISVRRF